MESPDIQGRFEALRQAYIAQNPVDLREDQAIEDAMAYFCLRLSNQGVVAFSAKHNPMDFVNPACVACDKPEGGGNR